MPLNEIKRPVLYLPLEKDLKEGLILPLDNIEGFLEHSTTLHLVCLSCSLSTMKIEIYTTGKTETAFYLYREDKLEDLRAVFEHSKRDIHRVIFNNIIGRRHLSWLTSVILDLELKGAAQNTVAIFLHYRFLGILHYSQGTDAVFMHRHLADHVVSWEFDGRVTINDIPGIEIQYACDCSKY
ncbi:hypothetical protein EDD18DRAFT_1337838 [Armillaria luteobubalina]|uniref:Uncharacterized protein n=1 Tax=Armillaria luteobubalina TaxID=153913 RepID=A0AA39UGC1_9AGAR|nr:hypothetical protein EDD18DRAFT_1337838 [Armillaria luteobubalina]